jgi:hypothetical protein
MPGQAKRMLETIIEQRAKGEEALVFTTKTKLIIKGVNPDNYTDATDDSPELIEKIRQIGREMGITV